MMILRLIPLKALFVTAALLVATIGGYLMTRQIKTIGQQELKIEQLEQNLQTRKRIDAAIRNAPSSRDDSIRVLDDFLNSRE